MQNTELRFDGQVAVVSGAGRGLGRAIALSLAARGCAVVVNDYGCGVAGEAGNNDAPAKVVAEEIIAAGGRAVPVVSDIGTVEGVKEVIGAALDLGGLHVIIHNASPVMPMTSFEDADPVGFDVTLNTNLRGSWELVRQAWSVFQKQNYGRVVLIGSAAGLWGREGMPAYSMAKSAMSGFVKYLAVEGRKFGINTNYVAPVAATRAWDGQNVPENITELMSPSYVAEAVTLFAHRECPSNGELFHSVGEHLSRVVIAQTKGQAFSSAESALAGFESVMKLDDLDFPAESNESGALIAARLFERAASQGG